MAGCRVSGDRKPVDQVGELCVKQQGRFGRVKESTIPVRIIDVSISGASVRAAADAELSPKQLAVFSVGGDAGQRAHRLDAARRGRRAASAASQFLDPRPAFLPTLYRWLGRESEVRPGTEARPTTGSVVIGAGFPTDPVADARKLTELSVEVLTTWQSATDRAGV